MLQLLLKASQDKKFVCEEAERTLKTMVVSTASIPLLHKVKVYVKHGNMRVRAKAAVSVAQCVSKMVCNESFGLLFFCFSCFLSDLMRIFVTVIGCWRDERIRTCSVSTNVC